MYRLTKETAGDMWTMQQSLPREHDMELQLAAESSKDYTSSVVSGGSDPKLGGHSEKRELFQTHQSAVEFLHALVNPCLW